MDAYLTDDYLELFRGLERLGPGSADDTRRALALLPELRLQPREPAREAEALAEIATWAGRFTSSISLDPPDTLLLEVQASLRLFGGLPPLCDAILGGLGELGFDGRLAVAPNPLAARWLARFAPGSLICEGSALEVMGGRAILSGLHGMFSLGAMGGAALAAGLLRLQVTPEHQLAGFGLLMALAVLAAARGMLDTHPAPEPHEGPQAQFAWPRGQLLVIGLLIFAGMSAEGVMYDWCVLYLKQELGMPQAQAGLGYAAFAGAMALARFAGDRLRARYPEDQLLAFSAGLSAFAMAVVLISGDPWVSLIGYALVGAGLAPVVPILYNAATRVPGTSRAAAIASVSSIGYSGFLIGPPLIGAIAHALTLTAAMGVVVVAASLLSIFSHRVPMADRASRP